MDQAFSVCGDSHLERFASAYTAVADERDLFFETLNKIADGIDQPQILARQILKMAERSDKHMITRDDIVQMVSEHPNGITAKALTEMLTSSQSLYCNHYEIQRIMRSAIDSGELLIGDGLLLFTYRRDMHG